MLESGSEPERKNVNGMNVQRCTTKDCTNEKCKGKGKEYVSDFSLIDSIRFDIYEIPVENLE